MYHVWKKTSTPPRRKDRGFTLIEMLLVVAIIAILIAVSIPAVSGALENARETTDEANERAAYTAAMELYLEGKSGTAYAYDAESGKIAELGEPLYKAIKPYGKCTKHKNGMLSLDIKTDGTIEMLWSEYIPPSGNWDDCFPHHEQWKMVV